MSRFDRVGLDDSFFLAISYFISVIMNSVRAFLSYDLVADIFAMMQSSLMMMVVAISS